ncbi:MAG: DUF4293 domain-containing protein [Bacteroidota bacterium]
MPQRPQTLCFLVLVLAMALVTVVPIWAKIDPASAQGYVLYAWYLQPLGPANTSLPVVYMPFALIGILVTVSLGIAAYQTFRYDDRQLQLRLLAFNVILLLGIAGFLMYLITMQERQILPGVPGGQQQFGFLLFVVAGICNLLAEYFIRKDEKLVSDSERMR